MSNILNAEEARSIADNVNIQKDLSNVLILISNAAYAGEHYCHVDNMTPALAKYLENELHYRVHASTSTDEWSPYDIFW